MISKSVTLYFIKVLAQNRLEIRKMGPLPQVVWKELF